MSSAAIRRLSNLMKEIPPEIDWLVDGLLPKGALSLLVAKPKVGKSTLARCLAAVISGSRDTWLGRKVATGMVLHFTLEEGERTVIKHYNEIAQISGMNADDVGVFKDPPSELQPTPIEALRGAISLYKPILVIIDPLFRFMPVGDGNDYSAVSRSMQDLIDLAHSGSEHVLLVHHAGKVRGGDRGDEVLGSTALAGSVDVVMSMRMDGDQRSLSAFGRDIEDFPDTILGMDLNRWIEPKGTVSAAKASARFAEVRDAIIDYMEQHRDQWKSTAEVKEGVGMNRQPVLEQLRWLANQGDIDQRGSGRKNSPYEYRL